MEPARVLLVQEQPISQIRHAMLGQDVTQQRGPHKAGVQLIFVVPKEFSEHLLGQAFIVRQMVFQCKDEPCLRFHGTSAGSGKIFFLHHLPLAVGDGLVVLSCFFQTENCGRFGNDLGTCRIVDVSDVGFVRRPVNAVCNGPGTVKRQPVSVMKNLSPSMVIAVDLADIIDPCFHALDLVFKDRFVTAEQIYIPRNDTRSIAPCAGTLARPECGDALGDHTASQELFLIQIV